MGPMTHFLSLLLLCMAADARRLLDRSKRQAVNSAQQLWPRKTVYYNMKYPFSTPEIKNIKKAMHEWSTFTCVHFQKVSSTNKESASFERKSGSCFSATGYTPGSQVINLGVDCMDADIVLHELGHTLGLMHEQERIDRNKYVKVDPATIKAKFMDQFKIDPQQTTYRLPYSYLSIMHYGKDFFNKKGFVAIQALNKKYYDLIGNAEHLSFRDAWIVNKMYKCNAHCTQRPTCPPKSFLGKDCRCWCPHVEYTAVDCLTGKAIDPTRVLHMTGRLMKNPTSNSQLYWSEHEFDWVTARDRCDAMGGALVDFKNPKVLTDLEYNIDSLLQANYEPLNKYKSQFIWVGGSDLSQEGVFRWLDGSLVNKKGIKFGRGEPNNGKGLNEDCLAIFPQSGSTFADWDCGKKLRYICNLKGDCHDLSPSCSYFKKTGSCSTPKVRASCKKTCGLCAPGQSKPKVHPTPQKQQAPKPKPQTNTVSNNYVYYQYENDEGITDWSNEYP